MMFIAALKKELDLAEPPLQYRERSDRMSRSKFSAGFSVSRSGV
jgi:hypothetical protein